MTKEHFIKEIPAIKAELELIKTPLKFNDSVHIYRWLFREQITLEMLPEKVFKEFKETEHYKALLNK